MATAQRARASIEIAAPPERVYDLVADVTRMGEWSPECYRCEWLDEARTAAEGVRFRGYNRIGPYRWQRTAVIVTARRGEEFGFTTVDDRSGREQTRWRYELQPGATGTVLTESFQFVWCPAHERVAELVIPRGRQVSRGIEQTLRRIKAAAERSARQH